MAIGAKIRFEVFKRDKFTCQYCGRSAPEVLLHVDHIQSVSKGGSDDILNLITSCADCNLGKGARELSDDAVIQKRKAQLDELQERREQIDMMLQWQTGLINIEDEEYKAFIELWCSLVPGYMISEPCIPPLKKLIKKYGLVEVME